MFHAGVTSLASGASTTLRRKLHLKKKTKKHKQGGSSSAPQSRDETESNNDNLSTDSTVASSKRSDVTSGATSSAADRSAKTKTNSPSRTGHKTTREDLMKDSKNMFNMGKIYSNAKKYDKAKENFLGALSARVALVGPEHPIVAEVHEQLGDLARKEEDVVAAKRHYKTAINILLKASSEHPSREQTKKNSREHTRKGKGRDDQVGRLMHVSRQRSFDELAEDVNVILRRVHKNLDSLEHEGLDEKGFRKLGDKASPLPNHPQQKMTRKKSAEWTGSETSLPTAGAIRKTASFTDFHKAARKKEVDITDGEDEHDKAGIGEAPWKEDLKSWWHNFGFGTAAVAPKAVSMAATPIPQQSASEQRPDTPGEISSVHRTEMTQSAGERRTGVVFRQNEGCDDLRSDLLRPGPNHIMNQENDHWGETSELGESLHSLGGPADAERGGEEAEDLGSYQSNSSARDFGYVASVNLPSLAFDRDTTPTIDPALNLSLVRKEKGSYDDIIAALELIRDGDYETALRCFRSALHSLVVALGTDHVQVSLVRERIGYVLVKMGRYHEAERSYDLALRNLRARVGNINEDVARVLACQGDLYCKMGKPSKALECYDESLSVRRELLAIDHRVGMPPSIGTSHVLHCVGVVHARRGSFESATSKFSTIIKQKNDPEAKDVMPYVFNSIANIQFKQGEFTQAISYYKKALKGHSELGGKWHKVETCGVCSNLGKAYFEAEQYDSAIQCLTKAAKMFENSDFDNKHLEVASIWTKLGSAYTMKKDYEVAMDFYIKSLKAKHVILKDVYHPKILLTRHGIALVLCKQGRFDDAMTIFEDIKSKRLRGGQNRDPDFAKLLIDMSSVYLRIGGAEELEKADQFCDLAVHLLQEHSIPEGHRYMCEVHNVVQQINKKSRL